MMVLLSDIDGIVTKVGWALESSSTVIKVEAGMTLTSAVVLEVALVQFEPPTLPDIDDGAGVLASFA